MPIENEQERHQAFEDACGGPTKAFRLLRIWDNCPKSSSLLYPNPQDAPKHWGVKGKAEIFTERAKREGYTDKQIRLFLSLQDS